MSRLICAFVVRIWHKQVFSWRGSYIFWNTDSACDRQGVQPTGSPCSVWEGRTETWPGKNCHRHEVLAQKYLCCVWRQTWTTYKYIPQRWKGPSRYVVKHSMTKETRVQILHVCHCTVLPLCAVVQDTSTIMRLLNSFFSQILLFCIFNNFLSFFWLGWTYRIGRPPSSVVHTL